MPLQRFQRFDYRHGFLRTYIILPCFKDRNDLFTPPPPPPKKKKKKNLPLRNHNDQQSITKHCVKSDRLLKNE